MKTCGLSPTLRLSLLLLLFATAVSAADGFLANYRKGLSAVENGSWEEARVLLEAAAGERPEAKSRLTRQAYLRPYLPHYYLGLARFELDDCEGALVAWQESQRQGVITKKSKLEGILGILKAKTQVCASQSAERQRALSDGVEWVELASKRAAEIEQLARGPELGRVWSVGSPSLAERFRRTENLISTARSRLQPGRAESDYERSKEDARRALDELALLRADAERGMLQAKVVETERAPIEAELRKTRTAANRILGRTKGLSGQPAVRARRRDLSQLLDETEGRLQVLSLAEIREYSKGIDRAASRLSVASQAPSSTLQRAAEAVFRARFEEAVSLIEGASFNDRRSRSHGQLLQSAAYFSIYLMHGAEDEVVLQAAVEAALRAKEAGPELVLPERSFSPRFIRFFDGISLASAPSGR